MDKIKEIIDSKHQSGKKHPFLFKTIGDVDVLEPKKSKIDPKRPTKKEIQEPEIQLSELKRALKVTNQKAARGQTRDLKKLGQKVRQKYKELALKKHKTAPLSVGEGTVQLRREIRKQRHLHPKRRMSCQICGLKVNDRKSLLAHCESRHSIRPEEKGVYFCRICRKSFNSERQQSDHQLGKLHRKTYRKLHPSKFN